MHSENLNVIDAIWFSSFGGLVGIVIVEDKLTMERKAYLGTASGLDERFDQQHIIDWGSKFSREILFRIMKQLKSEVKNDNQGLNRKDPIPTTGEDQTGD